MPNDVDLRKNVQLGSCKRIAGGWGASGTATNPGAAGTHAGSGVHDAGRQVLVAGPGLAHAESEVLSVAQVLTAT